MHCLDKDVTDYSDVCLIEELERRGYVIFTDDTNPKKGYEEMLADIQRLHTDYQVIGGKFFDGQLQWFFGKYAG